MRNSAYPAAVDPSLRISAVCHACALAIPAHTLPLKRRQRPLSREVHCAASRETCIALSFMPLTSRAPLWAPGELQQRPGTGDHGHGLRPVASAPSRHACARPPHRSSGPSGESGALAAQPCVWLDDPASTRHGSARPSDDRVLQAMPSASAAVLPLKNGPTLVSAPGGWGASRDCHATRNPENRPRIAAPATCSDTANPSPPVDANAAPCGNATADRAAKLPARTAETRSSRVPTLSWFCRGTTRCLRLSGL